MLALVRRAEALATTRSGSPTTASSTSPARLTAGQAPGRGGRWWPRWPPPRADRNREPRLLHSLSQSGAAGEDGRHGGRDQRWPLDPRPGRRLARARSFAPSAIRSTTGSAASRRRSRSSAACCATGTWTSRGPTTRCGVRAAPARPAPAGSADPVGSSATGKRMLRLAALHADIWDRRFRRRQSRVPALFRRGPDGVPNAGRCRLRRDRA